MDNFDIAYGAFDMRDGSSLDVAEKQIKDLSQKKPRFWYFDIIHTANQTPRALTWMKDVQRLIYNYSKHPSFATFVRLNTNDRKLRARNELFERAYKAGAKVKENGKDL